MLHATGVRSAFLDFGGSSQLAIGAPAERPEGWPVAVAGLERGSVHGVIDLRDAALSTSRSTGPGAPEGPIIDPRLGSPVIERRLATVLAADATTCEAWSTALVVRGRSGVAAARAADVDAFYEDAKGTLATGRLKPMGTKEKSSQSSVHPLLAPLPLPLAQHELLHLSRRRLR
jgi:thiamine biosynthesis lipoprotein ApbE